MTLMVRSLIVIAMAVSLLSGCYGFRGYDISAETASIKYFQNQAPIQSADLSQVFTNKLEQKVIRETPLRLVQGGGAEIEFSGVITGYRIRPVTVSGTERTEQSELTLTVQVDFVNSTDEKANFKQSFSASEQFDANQDLTSLEDQLLDSITDQLVDAIFNRAFVNW